jgi:hypothetical protein
MTHKSILNCPRIFTEPENNYQINTTLTTSISDTQDNDFTISATDTTDFKKNGYLMIGNEQFYYSSKTSTTFNNVYRNINKLTNLQVHTSGTVIYQLSNIINKLNNNDPKLSGWYIDGYSNQASLRVQDAPVIKPGVIRYIEDVSNPENSKFQGCINIDEVTGPEWQDFTAEKGDKGDDGGIQTVLEFTHISNNPLTDNITNSGEILKTETIDTTTETEIEIRRITSGERTINFETKNTIDIETNNDSIIINPKPMPYTYDITEPLTTIKGNDNNKAYGDTILINVALNKTVNKGQVVRYTNSTYNNNKYLTVEPFTFDDDDNDQFRKLNSGNFNMAIAGIALETVSSTTTFNQVLICTKGLCQIKITDNFDISVFDHTTPQITYIGRPCYLNVDGYGFNTAEQIEPDANFIEIGQFLETGNNIATAGTFILINFNPSFNTVI